MRQIAAAFNSKDNAGSVTVTNSATTTAVSHAAVTANSYIFLFPTTSAAAGEAATTYISAKAAGSFTITHANAITTRTFDYLIINK